MPLSDTGFQELRKSSETSKSPSSPPPLFETSHERSHDGHCTFPCVQVALPLPQEPCRTDQWGSDHYLAGIGALDSGGAKLILQVLGAPTWALSSLVH